MYSPKIPSENIISPKQNNSNIIIDEYPSTSICPVTFLTNIIIAAISAKKDDVNPIKEINLTGKYEKLKIESIASFIFFENVHLDFPAVLFNLVYGTVSVLKKTVHYLKICYSLQTIM